MKVEFQRELTFADLEAGDTFVLSSHADRAGAIVWLKIDGPRPAVDLGDGCICAFDGDVPVVRVNAKVVVS